MGPRNKQYKIRHNTLSTSITCQYIFKCGDATVDFRDSYKYLGLEFTEHLAYDVTVKKVAQSAHRALGLLISKVKLNGGVPFDCFVRLFDSLVWSIINYGASIWGTRSFPAIEKVHNRACRFFLGVSLHAPTTAVRGDTGLVPPTCRQYREVARQYARIKQMSPDRINHQVFIWASGRPAMRTRGWPGRVQKMVASLNLAADIETLDNVAGLQDTVSGAAKQQFIQNWELE